MAGPRLDATHGRGTQAVKTFAAVRPVVPAADPPGGITDPAARRGGPGEGAGPQARLRELEMLGAMGRLVEFLAQQVRNPLTNIALLTDQISRRVQDPEVLQRLSRIDAHRRLITDLVSEILRVASPRRTAAYAFDLRDSLRAAAQALEPYRRTEVDLRVDAGTRRALVFGNASRIREALASVMKSALLATERGSVEARLEPRDGRWAIVVADSSAGMGPGAIEQLFEPQATEERAVDVAGLGLFLSRVVVQGHGGSIEVTSQVGRGSTFTITLPSADDAGGDLGT